VISIGMFASCKLLTYATYRQRENTSEEATLAYLFAWPGMNAAEFLDQSPPVPKPKVSEWIAAIGKVVLGSAILVGVCKLQKNLGPLASGWAAIFGIITALHMGLFHLLSIIWRSSGRNAGPLMNRPFLASNLADFWGRRWNTAFRDLVYQFVFQPLSRTTSTGIATGAGYLASGLVHELAISVPAQGGFGLPTIYFLIQGIGVLAQRSRSARKLGLNRGVRGRIFTAIVLLGPISLLFHKPFVSQVIAPMMSAIAGQ